MELGPEPDDTSHLRMVGSPAMGIVQKLYIVHVTVSTACIVKMILLFSVNTFTINMKRKCIILLSLIDSAFNHLQKMQWQTTNNSNNYALNFFSISVIPPTPKPIGNNDIIFNYNIVFPLELKLRVSMFGHDFSAQFGGGKNVVHDWRGGTFSIQAILGIPSTRLCHNKK